MSLSVSALRRAPLLAAALAASLIAALYWAWIASERYVSEARVVVQRTDTTMSRSPDLAALVTGGAVGGERADQLLLRDHLLSRDMLERLDEKLGLRKHFSDAAHDPLTRLWQRQLSPERFQRYMTKRIAVDYDDYSGVLAIVAQAYDPKTAQAIAALLISEGEAFMNRSAHALAREQVAALERQVAQSSARVLDARRALLAYQNKYGLAAPAADAQNLGAIVAGLEARRAELETRRAALAAYLVPGHASLAQLDQQIAATDRQIARESAKLTAPGGEALNRRIEEFQRLELDAAFALDVHKTALAALEQGRVEATRTIKKLTVLQTPALPEYPLRPRRAYNAFVFALAAFLLAGILHLLVAIVRDHKD